MALWNQIVEAADQALILFQFVWLTPIERGMYHLGVCSATHSDHGFLLKSLAQVNEVATDATPWLTSKNLLVEADVHDGSHNLLVRY